MSIGPTQIILVLILVLILFGAGKLPSVMKDLGKGVKELKKGIKEEEGEEDEQLETNAKNSKKKK